MAYAGPTENHGCTLQIPYDERSFTGILVKLVLFPTVTGHTHTHTRMPAHHPASLDLRNRQCMPSLARNPCLCNHRRCLLSAIYDQALCTGCNRYPRQSVISSRQSPSKNVDKVADQSTWIIPSVIKRRQARLRLILGSASHGRDKSIGRNL